ncbi:hypothetical protein [Pseudarthrobacter sp. N5]
MMFQPGEMVVHDGDKPFIVEKVRAAIRVRRPSTAPLPTESRA